MKFATPSLCGFSGTAMAATTMAEDSSISLVHHRTHTKKPSSPSSSLSHLLRFSLIQCCSTAAAAAAAAATGSPPTIASSATDSDERPSISGATITGTFFGHRRGHVTLCLQQDRLATSPPLLLDLAVPTKLLAQEMHSGIVRIALECNRRREGSIPSDGMEPEPLLHSIPVWTTFLNGRRLGYSLKRRVSEKDRLIIKTVQSTSVGAGLIPSDDGEVMYMRAGFRRVVGSADSESYHLINLDGAGGQEELSVFLLRTG